MLYELLEKFAAILAMLIVLIIVLLTIVGPSLEAVVDGIQPLL
jgi:hypothetical protein